MRLGTRMIGIRRIGRALLVAAACGGAAACSAVDNWQEVRTPPSPQLTVGNHPYNVQFAPGSAALSSRERDRLRAFLATIPAHHGDRVVLPPAWGADGTGAGAELQRARNRAIAALAHEAGLEAREATGRAAAPPATDSVAVTVQTYAVTLPRCPNWTDRPGQFYGNQPLSGFGCSTAVNLGLMVANPGDLAGNEGEPPADGDQMSRAIDRYREGKINAKSPLSSDKQGQSGTMELTLTPTSQ